MQRDSLSFVLIRAHASGSRVASRIKSSSGRGHGDGSCQVILEMESQRAEEKLKASLPAGSGGHKAESGWGAGGEP